MTPLRLAWANLVHKRTRTLIAVTGVAFAVVLVFMELGMLGGVGRTATILYDKLQFDLLITSREYLDLSRAPEFPRARLAQARVAGVADVIPVSFGVAGWRAPRHETPFGTTEPGGALSVNIVAAPPDRLDRAFAVGDGGAFGSAAEARDAGRRLARLDTFLLDERSKPEFGDAAQLRRLPPDGSGGDLVRVNGRRASVVGAFNLGTGFSWNGMLLTSEETYSDFVMRSRDSVSFGLVQLEPGADPGAARQRLRAVLPPDVKVYTRAEINADERGYWLRLTSIGQFLLVAVVLAVVVGVIFVYQMMAADIRNMLPEYATVKALGYRPPYLTGVVLGQAVLLAVFGYVPGFAAALGLYYVARNFGGIPTQMTVEIAAGVLVLTCVMCLASGLLAVRKVHTADPADLF
ncbi:FtsX-like permease family protein [Gemmata obscuriglobus]|uniref:ABC transporter permease n=1 Tax=Gemmata obscuriglobus TaxID=114 RepID=A0A2Z3HGG4_9BACT|nr:FtsX-like permease family protein [Gemmata obscuriglobus]AWM40490.1 ABC transporter permease [Gemmata obscuriglobus]QEG26266.1 FtsX-like permease family protein [Gemmata obscuriglobus]VTS01087.1 abc transporter : DevC protein OS=Leptolyngbya sp. PCC 7375 GN=Lepto7375DRAFT_3296 PE=4 SV=1: FtsX [Gemmata obscuriglobus UQM 2246]